MLLINVILIVFYLLEGEGTLGNMGQHLVVDFHYFFSLDLKRRNFILICLHSSAKYNV